MHVGVVYCMWVWSIVQGCGHYLHSVHPYAVAYDGPYYGRGRSPGQDHTHIRGARHSEVSRGTGNAGAKGDRVEGGVDGRGWVAVGNHNLVGDTAYVCVQ